MTSKEEQKLLLDNLELKVNDTIRTKLVFTKVGFFIFRIVECSDKYVLRLVNGYFQLPNGKILKEFNINILKEQEFERVKLKEKIADYSD